MVRDADAALAESGSRMQRSMKRVLEQRDRADRMKWMLKNNHFAEAFKRELQGGDDDSGG